MQKYRVHKIFEALRYLPATALVLLVFSAVCSGQSAADALSDPKADPAGTALRYGFVVDNSGSLRTQLDNIVEIVKNITEENSGYDEAFLVRFINSDKIKLSQEFTSEKALIHDAADQMYIEGGQTAILDGVIFAAKYLESNSAQSPHNPRALILVTDGDDRESKARIDSVTVELKKMKIRVFAVGISDAKVELKTIERLARDTGGTTFIIRSRAELATVGKEVAAAMRKQ